MAIWIHNTAQKCSFKQRLYVGIILLTVTLLFLMGCNTEQSDDIGEYGNVEQPGDDREYGEREGVSREEFSGQSMSINEPETPQLAGGSEQETREPQPVSNELLQREFPNVLVLRGPSNSNKVALTFDDGPDPRYTPKVLDVLNKHGAKATFFMMGARAAVHRELVERVKAEGHAIGNHTYWHPNLAKGGTEQLNWEITETEKVLKEITGSSVRLFRAPYGSLNRELVERLGEMNYTVVGWSVDSLDWEQLSAEEITNNVLSNVHPGAIILMHDGGNWDMDLSGMIEALDEIIPRLQKDGMEFVTIPELINLS